MTADRAPVEDTERLVARLWEEALGVEGLGPDDNFFLRGGRSMLAMKVVMRLRQETGKEVALVDLFRAPVLGQFAVLLNSRPVRE